MRRKITITSMLVAVILLAVVQSFAQETRPPGNIGTGFFVKNGKMFDPNGIEFVGRGINITTAWGNTAINQASFVPAAKTGSNIVRVGTRSSTGQTDTPAELKDRVDRAIANCMAPMVEKHDYTCGTFCTAITNATNFWKTCDWLKDPYYEKFVMLNIANEWGNRDDPQMWKECYKTAITELRNWGYRGMFVLDASLCGQMIDNFKDFHQEITAHDPMHNVLYSIHMYAYWRTADDDADVGTWPFGPYSVEDELTYCVNNQIPIFVGEFGWTPHSETAYNTQLLLEKCHELGIGWTAWAWKDNSNNSSILDMALQGDVYNTDADLTDYGRMVVNHPWGTKACVRPANVFPGCGSTCQPVSSISITNCPTTSLAVSGTVQLNTTISPTIVCNSNKTWSSGNTSVATVSATGLVTAVSNGSAVITVTTTDGGKTATCTITVGGSTPPPGITIQAEDFSSQSGGSVSTAQAGYTGTGYYDMGSTTSSFVEYTFTAPAGIYNLSIRYANGSAGNRSGNVITDGVSALNNFAPTGSWTTWVESTAGVTLTGTNHTLRIQVASASGGPNVDRLVLTSTGSTPIQYTLTTTTSGSGSIALSPPGGTYTSGTSVSATATPATGWQFSGWSGAATGSANPVSILMNANKSLTATFTQIPVSSGYQYYRFTCTATNETQMIVNGIDIMVGSTAHNLSGYWQVLGMPTTATKTLNVGSQVEATAVRINTVFNTSRAPRDYKVEGSDNNSTWTVLLQETGVAASFWPSNSSITIPFTAGGGGARLAMPAEQTADSEESMILVFPNPASREVTLQGAELPARVTISNLIGQRVKSLVTKDGTIDVSDLSKGIYLFNVNNRIIRMIKE